MITISDKKQCCGCSACSQICPAKCITMSADSEGFFYPQVDKAECTGCGLCESVCPILNGNRITSEQTVYAAYTEDEIRMSSSSGGIFPLLADTVLAEGGVVFGAAFTRELSVQHIMVSSPDQLKKLQGSKYLQSDINGTYAEVKRQLAEGRRVLFSGTGCQIAGLKKYLGNDPDMLLTVDVICHGVPSENVWRTYLEWLEKENGAAVEKVTLRDKKTGWKTYSVSVEFGNGNKYDQIHKKDLYMQTFLKDICLRPSCYDCRFKPLSSQADITLGDCWGIHKYMPEMDDDKGCSIILVHTGKGANALDLIRSRLVIKQADLSRLSQPMISRSAKEHPARARFFRELQRGRSMDGLSSITKPTFWDRVIKR